MRFHSKKTGQILDEIRLQGCTIPCIIGIYPEERERLQAVQLNLVLYLDARGAALTGQLGQSIDYAALLREVSFILRQGQFLLLESAAEAIASYILAEHPSDLERGACELLEIELIKPEALGGQGVPALRILRRRDDYRPLGFELPWQMLFSCPETAVFRGIVAAGSTLPLRLADHDLSALFTARSGLELTAQSWLAGEDLLISETNELFAMNASEGEHSFLAVARRSESWRINSAELSQGKRPEPELWS